MTEANPAHSPFLDGVSRHLRAFANAWAVDPDEVFVRLNLADGTTFVMRGLKPAGPFPPAPNGWGMVEISDPVRAVVVREAHVLKVEFALAPEHRPPIGLQSEATSPPDEPGPAGATTPAPRQT